jgi:rod shape-determining protein MreC
MVLKNRKFGIVATAGALLIVAIALPTPLSLRGKGAVRNALAPAQRGTANLGQRFNEALSAIRGIGGNAEEIIRLQRELIYVQAELGKLRKVEQENLRLQRNLNYRQHSPRHLIACNVISRNISGWWHSVRIGKGSKQGILPNHAVISPDGLVGKTTEVTKNTAEVLLVCDPSCRVSAEIIGATTFGLVRGLGADLRGHPRARMDFINKDAEIRVGDEVVTSGLGGDDSIFPRGIHIGYIEEIFQDESGLYQYAEIVPRATGVLLENVFVIAESTEEGDDS